MHVFNDFCYNVMQLSDPQPQLTNRKAPKVLKEGPNRKEEEEEDGFTPFVPQDEFLG